MTAAAAARLVYFVYGAWLIVGGVLGWNEKHSLISLIAGGVTGALALAAAVLLVRNPTGGLALGLATALLVGGSFLPRFLKSPHFYPGGLTLLLSVVALAVSVAALLAARGGR